MPLRTIRLKPGVDVEQSAFLNATQLTASNLIRFYAGLVQKLGGWAQLTADLFLGVCRGLKGWSDIQGNPYLAVGTEQRLYVLIGGTLSDITPLVATTNPAVNFSTVITSPTVTIVDAGHNPAIGDWINLLTQVSIGGIVLFGFYQVQTVPSGTSYTVTAASPATATVNNAGAVPSYTTTNLSPVVNVLLNDHGLATGSLFNAVVSTTVATVVISGIFSVTVIDANNFQITASTPANANTTASENAGNARIQYLLPTGFATNTPLTGYGIGDYGAGDYGLSGAGQITSPLRQWSLDNFGQDLIASPSNGGIYYWAPPVVTPALIVSGTAPTASVAVFVMPQAEIIVALGAEVAGTQQPMLIRWCDAADFTAWNATATNQAGSYPVPTGNTLIGGLPVGLGAWFWTDAAAWTITYIGFPLVFGFNKVGDKCGLVAQRAAGTTGSIIMWLGFSSFFSSTVGGGGVAPMECSVWDFYIQNVDLAQLGQIHCAPNPGFNEMAWHFPLKTSSPLWNALAPMGYVKYNYVEKVWDYGLSSQYQRTAWEPQPPGSDPVGADNAGLLQQHEVGTDANGVGMQWSWQTAYFTLQEGEDFIFSDLIIPDFVSTGSPVMTPTVLMTDYPDATPTQALCPQITPSSNWITYSARGRYMALGMAGSDLGTFNRLGGFKVRFSPDGKN